MFANTLKAVKEFHSSQSGSLICPDAKAVKGVGAESLCNSDIRRVPSLGQENPANARSIVPWVERMAITTEISFEPRCEITRWIRRRRTHIAEIPGAVARGNVQGSAERHR